MSVLKSVFLALIIAPYYLVGLLALIGLASFLINKADRLRKGKE